MEERMSEKPGRNDPCPCGSGKKYKSCCFSKDIPGKKKFKASLLSRPKSIDLMERTFGNGIAKTREGTPSSLADRVGSGMVKKDAEKKLPEHDDSSNDKPVTL
jgi:uncharacterized protein